MAILWVEEEWDFGYDRKGSLLHFGWGGGQWDELKSNNDKSFMSDCMVYYFDRFS